MTKFPKLKTIDLEINNKWITIWLNRPKVKNAFATLWETDDLVVSFDGACWIPKKCYKRDTFWCHSDQSPLVDKFVCAQGFVSLTDNKERTLVIWKDTHKIHSKYLKLENIYKILYFMGVFNIGTFLHRVFK